jgi:hypothetical protein
VKELVKTVCIVAFTAMACLVLADVHLALRDLRRDAGGLTSQVSTTLAQINATEKDTSAKLAADEQQISDTAVAVKHIVQRADQQLYGRDLRSGLFGQAAALLARFDALAAQETQDLHGTALDVHATIAALQPALANLTAASAAAADDLADPAIRDSLHHIDAAAVNVAGTSQQFLGVTTDMHKGTTMAVQAEYDWLHPAPEKLAVRLLKFFGGHLVDGTELAWYLHNWNNKQ